MADATMVIANAFNLFGLAPSDLWNAYNWNAFKWGEGTADSIQYINKNIANTSTYDSSLAKNTDKNIANTATYDSAVAKNTDKAIANTATYDSSLVKKTDKNIANTSTYDSALAKSTIKLIEDAFIPDSDVEADPAKVISNDLSFGGDLSSEVLQDGTQVWDYVFVKPSINAKDRSTATFTSATNGSTAWTSGSTTTIWS